MIVRADVVFPYLSGLPRDCSVNTFHMNVPTVGDPAFEAIGEVLEEAYNQTNGSTGTGIHDFLSAYITRGTDECLIKMYDAQNEGPPLYEWLWTLNTTAATGSMPFEVAACLSYTAYAPPANPRRRRGRIFVGPLTTTSSTAGGSVPPVVATGFRGDLVFMGEFLASNADLLAEGVQWGVYSRADDAIRPITAGWVDNEFDTQRRRQAEPSFRETWAVPLP